MSYIRYNLQLFAKDGPGGEKTEPATQKKLNDARKEGQVAKSGEIVNAVYLLVIFYILKFLIGIMGEGILESFSMAYQFIPTYATGYEDIVNIGTTSFIMKEFILKVIIIVLPIFAVTFLINFVLNVAQVKWKPTGKPLQPKFNKLSPMKGIKRIFSKQSLINLLKSTAVVGICIYIIYNEWLSNYALLYGLYDMSFMDSIETVGNIALDISIRISVVYIFIGFADYIFQKRKFNEDMKMTKQEVKDEYKNTEGDPQVKGQQRRRMREASQRRMMQQLPEADVVITNPTHFAVALKYDLDIAPAPIVLAKGEDYLAQKIKETAKEYGIEIYENKPLARALYQSVDVGEEIPQELYQAVAEVLAFVYNLKNNQ